MLISPPIIEPNIFYHLAVTYDGTRITLYVNTIMVQSDVQESPSLGSSEPILIGAFLIKGALSENLNGDISSLRIWNIAKSQEAIAADIGLKTPIKKDGLILDFPMTSSTYEINGNPLSAKLLSMSLLYNGDFVEDKMTFLIRSSGRITCLKNLLRSIRATYKKVLIHVADDGPTLHVAQLQEEFLDEITFYHKIDTNCGAAAAKNFLTQQAKTEFVVMMEEDYIFTESTNLKSPLKVLAYSDKKLVGGCTGAAGKGHQISVNNNVTLHITPHLSCGASPSEYKAQRVFPEHTLAEAEVEALGSCFEADLVPNFFMARRTTLHEILWDDFFKVSDREDFFLRGKKSGLLKVAMCFDFKVEPQKCSFPEGGGALAEGGLERKYWPQLFRKHQVAEMNTEDGRFEMTCGDKKGIMTDRDYFKNCRVDKSGEHTTATELLQDLKDLDRIQGLIQNPNKKTTIAILVMATGKYLVYVRELVESGRRFLLKNHEVVFYVFTDGEIHMPGVKVIEQAQLGWPYDTMSRLRIYYDHRDAYESADFVYTVDSDALFVGKIGDEILGDLVATYTSWFFKNGRDVYTYDANPGSRAYISYYEGTGYFAGGFFGGTYENFVKLCKEVAENIEADLRAEVPYIALWHDESHLNWYFVSHPPTIRLPPNYMYPEPPADKRLLAAAPWVWLTGDNIPSLQFFVRVSYY
eukprot:Phypoly_transcript_01034.p1 GENE.Phypoly_transcript_01034~~Phypoly_transcript_01034.p1  ORF type:complete len:694 (+),score=124.93 Phypoly_transcript_01034:1677-3758(+)